MDKINLVIKRGKKAQRFSLDKVKSSIRRVFKTCKQDLSDKDLDSILADVTFKEGMRTEEIQREVENSLMKHAFYNEARFFIIYRHIHYYDNFLGNKVKFMKDYLGAENAATGSTFDANANVTETNLTTLSGELFKGDIIQLNRHRMYSRITKDWGKEIAEWYIWWLQNHFGYKHDESSIFPYCVAISLYPYLTSGLGKLGGLSTPPKNLDSFCGSFTNLIFAIAAQYAGAVATPEFLPYFDYFARKDLGDDYTEHLNEFVMIGPKLRELMNKTGIWFKNIDELKEYQFDSEYLSDLQVQIVNDATRSYTEEELKQVISDTVNNVPVSVKLGDGSRTIGSYLTQKFQQIVYTLNQPSAARNFQSVFWNIGYFDKYYFQGIFGDFYFPDGTKMNWGTICDLQKLFIEWFNKERTKALLTFPVESFSLLVDKDNKFKDESAADFVAWAYSKGHSFFTYISDNPDSLSSCCRLRNEVSDNQFSFSLGMSGVMTGSKSVMTMNINRTIQYAVNNKLNYLDYIREQVKNMQKAQISFNNMLYEFKEQGALPVYDANFITLEKQYLTLGINGMVEAAEFLGIPAKPTEEYQQFVDSILSIFKEENTKIRLKSIEAYKKDPHNHKIMMNTEFVPAENLGCKNYKWDKKDGYVVPENRNCYNSYFYASEDTSLTILDKFKLHGREFVKSLDGGSALHMNLDQHLSQKQYRQLLNIAAANGTNYFTFNIPNTICNDCGHIDKRYMDHCPVCGSKNIDYATRVIGYLKRVSNFSHDRQVEANRRYYTDEDKDKENLKLRENDRIS
jgi:ribonucleoside-triphosphate reductase